MSLLRPLICIAVLFAAAGCFEAAAVPANPKPALVTQPDGTTLTIRQYGDEFFNYATTLDGYNIVCAKDGIFYYAELADGYKMAATNVKAKDMARRSSEDRAFLSSKIKKGVDPALAREINLRTRARWAAESAGLPRHAIGTGIGKMGGTLSGKSGNKVKSLVILVNFSDKSFIKTNDDFKNLLNQPDYSDYGATGSVADYYRYNSNGNLDPEYVVVGPFTLDKTNDFYASSYYNARTMAREAAEAAYAAGVDMTQFVSKGNTLRDVFIYYPGHAIAGGNTIWPHKWSLDLNLGGYKLTGYACASELRDTSGSDMASIGTFCHEFGHVMGWPDFYDTDYRENGLSPALDCYSVMDFGCYNNDGCSPPSFNAMERYLQGWLIPAEFESNGQYTVKPISEGEARMVKTSVPGEYFLLEVRAGADSNGPNVWDRMLAATLDLPASTPILMVYHVDQSDNMVRGKPARDSWGLGSNTVNAYADHECLKVVRADATYPKHWGYPGPCNVTELYSDAIPDFREWSRKNINMKLHSIDAKGNNIVLNVLSDDLPGGCINVVNIADTYAEFEWNSFPHTGSFTAELFDAANERLQHFDTDRKSATLTMLRPSTAYKLKVTAKGGSGLSDEVAFETTASTEPNEYINVVNITDCHAEFEWSSFPHTGSFTAELFDAANERLQHFDTDRKAAIVTMLRTSTAYRLKVTAKGGGDQSDEVAFKTNSSSAPFPYLPFKSTYSVGETITLCLAGLTTTARSFEWMVDGAAVDTPTITATKGKHVISVKVILTDGNEDIFTKTIEVQ